MSKLLLAILKIVFLFPISLIYGLVVLVRNFFYDRSFFKSTKFDIPIISIGNISVGGTGKTPHTEYFVRMFKDDFNIAVLSRGYMRKTKGFFWVESHSSHLETGDEPLQIKQKFTDTTVAVCENRVEGVNKILESFPEINLIILDDAFQHRKLKPRVSILLNN